jgi:hypothetical protein
LLLLLVRLLVLGQPCLHPSCHVDTSTSYAQYPAFVCNLQVHAD